MSNQGQPSTHSHLYPYSTVITTLGTLGTGSPASRCSQDWEGAGERSAPLIDAATDNGNTQTGPSSHCHRKTPSHQPMASKANCSISDDRLGGKTKRCAPAASRYGPSHPVRPAPSLSPLRDANAPSQTPISAATLSLHSDPCSYHRFRETRASTPLRWCRVRNRCTPIPACF